MHYATLRKRADVWAPFKHSLDFVKRHLIDGEYGGWYGYGSYDPRTPAEGRRAYRRPVWTVGYQVSGRYGEA